MAKHWIAGAIKHPGALHRTAERICKEHSDTISGKCRAQLHAIANKTGDTTLKRRLALADTLRHLGRSRK